MNRVINYCLVLLASLLVLNCSKNVKNYTLADAQQEEVKEKIRKELSDDEQQLLLAGTLRYVLEKGINLNNSVDLKKATKTIGELIENQQKFINEKKEERLKQEVKEKKRKLEIENKINEMKKILSAKVISKSFYSQDYDEYNVLFMEFKNISEKDLKAFKGVFKVYDIFDNNFINLAYEYDEKIKSSNLIRLKGMWDYNQFENKDVKLKTSKFSKLKFVWEPEVIVLNDGTKLEVEQE